ncbi:hypothetical protein AXG93_1504s1310 [Marchantia polymorpha subsp. ruderalis]|uniref:Uncharacterized protein n=1 Tax=Marchantia polymorpha subsp. ruderalis TaxID=1480154 RepID=A0A176VPV3_MARPO|nr:hypothetical protein AXG93_1504s1310 [Marchantia polymorpha subsp. ruderalis]
MSVPSTHRRLPVDRRPLAEEDFRLRIGGESSPKHRRAPTHRQDSPPVQRRKGKEPADLPPSVQGALGQGPSAVRSPRYAPSAPGPSGHRVTNGEPAGGRKCGRYEGRKAGNAPSAENPPEGSSEAAGAPAAAEHADISQPRTGQSPTNSMATEILNSEDDEEGGSTESVSGSESTEEEEQEMVGAPTAALCEQVVPLLRYLDRKVEKYADPRQPGSYVELVRRRTRTKVHTSKLLARVDQELKDLRERHACLWGFKQIRNWPIATSILSVRLGKFPPLNLKLRS